MEFMVGVGLEDDETVREAPYMWRCKVMVGLTLQCVEIKITSFSWKYLSFYLERYDGTRLISLH